jgi:drug/metabolite transporter (DMT)-like permease
MIGSGANAVIQKIHQNSDFKAELAPFIFYAFLFAALFSFILSLTLKKDADTKNVSLYKKKSSVLLMIIGGAVIGILNVMNLKLAGQLPAVIHFPVYNICSMILTSLAGRLFFKEKIGKRKLIGFIIGLFAITIIGLL